MSYPGVELDTARL